MPITTQQSSQIANATLVPVVRNPTIDLAKLTLARVDFTQVGVGSIGSTFDLVKLGAGRIRIIPALSWLTWSAWGTSATLNIGHTGYTKLDGTVVAAAPAAIDDTRNVAAAGFGFLGVGAGAVANTGAFDIENKADLLIQGIVAGAVVPDAATLKGFIAFVRD